MKKLLAFLGMATLIAAALFAVAGPERRRDACVKIGLCNDPDMVGAMLVSVQRQKSLIVLTARLVAPVTSARDTTVGPITVATTRQTAILPARVDYVLDLAAMRAGDLNWDEDSQTLRVKRPAVQVGKPAIDWEKAQVYRDGNFATALTSVNDNLQTDNAKKAPALFVKQAHVPELMRMADDAADAAIATLFRMPLVAAGFADAKVVVER